MPRIRRRGLGRRGWTSEHVGFLRHGWELFTPFVTGWDNMHLHPDDRKEWWTPERLDEVRDCWEALLAGRVPDPDGIATEPDTWARLVFEEGVPPEEASMESFWRSDSGKRLIAANEAREASETTP